MEFKLSKFNVKSEYSNPREILNEELIKFTCEIERVSQFYEISERIRNIKCQYISIFDKYSDYTSDIPYSEYW